MINPYSLNTWINSSDEVTGLELKCKILGSGSALPNRVITNFDLEKIIDTSDEWIVTRTGIKERRFAEESVSTSDMAAEAAMKAIEAAGLTPEDIDLIIVGTITPDMVFPSTACLVQDKIGAKKAAAFDLEAACTGFIYGLAVAQQFISTGFYKHILVIGAETMSRIIDMKDRNTAVIFGDGAGAVVVGPSDGTQGIMGFDLGADGDGGRFLYMPAGGSAQPATEKTVADRLHYVKMEGKDVFRFAVRAMENSSVAAVEKSGLAIEEINYLVPHQANMRIIGAAAKKMNLPMEKVHVNLDRCGNMSAASIPVALDEAIRGQKIKAGDNVVVVGFGGGLTWGACVIKF